MHHGLLLLALNIDATYRVLLALCVDIRFLNIQVAKLAPLHVDIAPRIGPPRVWRTSYSASCPPSAETSTPRSAGYTAARRKINPRSEAHVSRLAGNPLLKLR
jgi:hypothetical protein